MQGDSLRRPEQAADESSLTALARLATGSFEVVERDLRARIATLEAQAHRYQAVIDNIPPGVCMFDGEKRLILCNRGYMEIYRLTPEQVRPGASLREIVEHRVAAGTCAMAADDYLSFCASDISGKDARTWTIALGDGRTVQIRHRPMPDGGWVSMHEDITELQDKRAIANERLSLQALIDWLPDNLWVKDVKSRFVISNQITATRIGVAGPADLIGKTDLELLPKEIAQKFFADEQKIVQSGQPMIDMEEYVFDSSGGKIWISTTKVPLRNNLNEIFAVAGMSRDITERKRADALRDGQAQVLHMIAQSAPLGDVLDHLMRLVESQLAGIFGSVLLLDEDGNHLRHGAAPSLAEAYTKAIDGARIGPKVGSCGTAAYRREAVIVDDILSDPLWADFKDLAAAYGLRSCWSTPILSHLGAVLGTFAMYSATVRKPTEAETRLVDVATRIAGIAIERRQAEDRIRFMADHDSLTGLANRNLLRDRLTQAVVHAKRHDRWVAVAFVDLDSFKIVNDSLGHGAGDELLKIVARRMVDCVRATDTVVRLGGDEFVIVLFDQPDSVDVVAATLQKISAAIAEPIHLEGHDLRVTSSLGVAIYPNDGMDAETLLANADAAMYRAKETGRDNFQFYTPELNAKVQARFLLQEELRNAVARCEFTLFYQPQVDLRTGRVFAVEALVRWNHPTRGVMAPIDFIPLAEETGLIVPLGDWVLREACRQNKAWQGAGLPPMTVCVNVSARQFRDKSLISRVVSALSDSGLDAEYLELEMTESLIMQDVEQAVATMAALQGLGVRLSIDDFGTGYSSLSALKNFPVDRLKIDKSFITDLATNENDKAVASAVIALGQKLNLRVIAEGVETDEQAAFLCDNNCDEMQGFHFSMPIPTHAIEKLLRATHDEQMGSRPSPESQTDAGK